TESDSPKLTELQPDAPHRQCRMIKAVSDDVSIEIPQTYKVIYEQKSYHIGKVDALLGHLLVPFLQTRMKRLDMNRIKMQRCDATIVVRNNDGAVMNSPLSELAKTPIAPG